MNNWRVIGYICIVVGFIAFIIGLIMLTILRANPALGFLGTETYQSMIINGVAPWIITSVVLFVISGLGFYYGRTNKQTKKLTKDNPLDSNILERINRLETVIDNNFAVVDRRLDKIEQTNSQNTLLKAKQE